MFKQKIMQINILLLKPWIRTTVYIILYTVIYLTMCPNVFAMQHDRETVKNIFDAAMEGDEVLLRTLVESITNIQDPGRIAEINRLIGKYRVQYGIPMDIIQGNDTLTIANSGLPESRSWRSILTSAALFVGASVIIYLIYRNFHHLTDLFRDIGERVIDIGRGQLNAIRGITQIVRYSPEVRNAFLNELLMRELLQHGFERVPPPGVGG